MQAINLFNQADEASKSHALRGQATQRGSFLNFSAKNNYSNQPRSIRAYTFDSQGFHETKLAECFTYKNYKKTNYKAYSFDSESLYWLLRDSREIIWKRDFELLAPTSSYLAARRLRTNSTGHTFCLYLSARDFRPLGGRQKANVLVF